MPMYHTAETPRGGRRKKSLLSTLKKSNSQKSLMDHVDLDESAGSDEDLIFFQQAHEESIPATKTRPRKPALPRLMRRSNSTGNLMDDCDDSNGSDSDLIFFQQAHEESNTEAKETSKSRRKQSLLSTLKRSNSTGKLMDGVDYDESNRSDSDLVFFQQAHEESNTEAKSTNRSRRKQSLLSTLKRSSSTGKLMDGVADDSDYYVQTSKAADSSSHHRGRRTVSHLVQTIRRSTSKSKLDDGSDRSDGELNQIETLEDIESSITSNTPRSDNKKKRLRARLKAMGGGEAGDLGASSHHSTKSGRSSRIASKSPARLSESYDASPQGRRRERKMKPPARLSCPDFDTGSQSRRRKSPARPLEDSDHGSLDQKRERRISKREKNKVGKEKQLSTDSDDRDLPLSFDQLIKKKERQESLTTPRLKKKRSKSNIHAAEFDLAPPVTKQRTKRPSRSKSSNDIIMHDDSTVSTKDMTDEASPAAENSGKKRVPKQARKTKSPIREVLIRPDDSPHQMKRQSIMNELDELDDRESITTMYLNRQIEALKAKVQDLNSENTNVQDQLDKEILQNGRLAMKLREHELGLAALEQVNETKITVEVLKKEHESEKRDMELLLKEKESFIGRLQQKINSIRVANDTMRMQQESSRKVLTESHGDDVEGLQRKVEAQKSEIEDLSLKLFVQHEYREKDKRQINDLQGALQETKDEKKKLEAELKTVGKEHTKALKRKDETIDFLQQALAHLKLKESKQRDKEREKGAKGSGSPFGRKKQRSPRRGSTGGKGSPGRYHHSPGRRLSIRGYLGSGDDSEGSPQKPKSTSRLNLPL